MKNLYQKMYIKKSIFLLFAYQKVYISFPLSNGDKKVISKSLYFYCLHIKKCIFHFH